VQVALHMTLCLYSKLQCAWSTERCYEIHVCVLIRCLEATGAPIRYPLVNSIVWWPVWAAPWEHDQFWEWFGGGQLLVTYAKQMPHMCAVGDM